MKENRMTLGDYLKAYFKQCLEVFKHPKMLLPTAILAVVWIGLGILQNMVGENLPMSMLNFLTYAQGGLYGGILGAIGGILGKIVVAAFVNVMIVPLFYKKNPFANFKQGFNEVVANVKFQGNDAISSLLKGAGAALLLYSIFNVTQSFENSMVGIVSAVAVVSAVARKGGFLWGLVLSFLNSVSKKKVPTYQQLVRLLTGMSLGFSLGVVLCVLGTNWAGSIGLIALIVGLVMGGGSKKEAVASVLLIGVFLMASPQSGKSLGNLVKLGWVLESVEEDMQSSGSGGFFADKGTISNLRVDVPAKFEAKSLGHLCYDYTSTDKEHPSGHATGTFQTIQKEFFMPGEETIFGFSGSEEFSDLTAFGSGTEVFDDFRGYDGLKGVTIKYQNLKQYKFPDPEEIGSKELDVHFYIHILSAHIGYIYHFKYYDFDDDEEIAMPNWFTTLFGGDKKHASDVVTILIGILGAAGGVAGAGLGGGIGGGGIPTGDIPGGEGPLGDGLEPKNEPTPEELEMERYQKEMDERFKKYVHDNPDGTKTYIDPATGEPHTLYPKYNTETGEFSHWENENDSPYDEEKLNDWLAWRERNNETFAQDATQAQQNLEEQRAMNKAQNDYDRERGSSAMADKWKADKEQMQKDFEHEMRLRDYAWKKGLTDTDKETLTKALLKDRHEALEEGAQAMNDAAYWNDKVNDAEFYEHTADVVVNVMGEFPGNRGVKNFYTVLKSLAKHGMTGAVKGKGWGEVAKELSVGAVEGGLSVLQNQEMTGVFGTSLLGKLVKAGVNVGAESTKSIINDVMDPNKSASEILDNATNAGLNRVLFEGIGEVTKAAGGHASDATPSGASELGSFSQEMGFHNSAAETLGHELSIFRRKIFGV